MPSPGVQMGSLKNCILHLMDSMRLQQQNEISCREQVAVVTGGGRGIGRAIAQALAAAGASVAVLARSQNEIDETVRLIEQNKNSSIRQPSAFSVDVADERALRETMRRVEQSLGPVDVLVNNAGSVKTFGPFWENDFGDWWSALEVNLYGAALCTHSVLPGMIARRRGRIINVSSGAGTMASPFFSSYITSKTALIRFTECLALETASHGVAIFAISPGTVRTAMSEYSLHSPEGQKWLPWFRRIFDEGINVPAERPAQLVLELASGQYDALSGRMISIFDDLAMMLNNVSDMEQRNLYALKLEKLQSAAINPAYGSILVAARNAAKTSR